MIVYDFDGTIYDGDSTLDFYFFCLKSRPTLLRYWPRQFKGFIGYHFKVLDKTAFKERFFSFLSGLTEIGERVDSFWHEHEKKIKPWYLAKKHDKDIIISASPYFLLKPICDKLKVRDLIASEVDGTTGRFKRPNCFGQHKTLFFKEKYPDGEIEEFYSDSLHDAPLAELALNAYMVTGSHISNWPKVKETHNAQ